jgi:hypothetical protein
MMALPMATPITIPEPEPTEAMVESLLVQAPPAEVLLSVVADATQTPLAPLIAPREITVTGITELQPVPNE